MPTEKRRFPRFEVILPVELKDRGRVQDLVTSDASRHGVYLRTDSPRPVRQLLQLKFQLPDGAALEVMGMVARSVPPAEAGDQGPGMGVDFFAMSKGARDVWENFVRELTRAAKAIEAQAKIEAERPPVDEEAAVQIPEPEGSVTRPASQKPQRVKIPEPRGDPTKKAPLRPRKGQSKIPEPEGSVTKPSQQRPRKATRLEDLFDELPNDAALPEQVASESPEDLSSKAKKQMPQAPVRRKQLRYVASFMVRLKDKARLRQFYTRDIGGGGMFLKTPLLKKEGDDVQLVLIHPESDQEFRLGGTVARVSKDRVMAKRGMGIHFHPRNNTEEKALLSFIDSGAEFLDPPPNERESTITALRTAIKVAPDSAKAHFTLGRALLDQDRLPEAIEELEKALLLDADYMPAHRAMQEAFAKTGDSGKAFEHLRHVKRLERRGWTDEESV